MTELERKSKNNLAEVVGSTIIKLGITLDKLRKADEKFAEKPSELQLSAELNLNLINYHISKDLGELCRCIAFAGKGPLIVNFAHERKLLSLFSADSFVVRLNNQKVELAKPDFSLSDNNEPEIMGDSRALKKMFDRGGKSRKAIEAFAGFSREEVGLKIMKAVESFAKGK